MEEDELISDKEDVKVCAGSRLISLDLHLPQAVAAQSKKQATAERQQKKQRRKAAEGQLQIKRKEMDKAKVRVPLFILHAPTNGPVDRGRRPAVFISSGPDGALQTFRGHQGILFRLKYRPFQTVFQRASDPEYAAMMDVQPKPKGRGRKKAVYVLHSCLRLPRLPFYLFS